MSLQALVDCCPANNFIWQHSIGDFRLKFVEREILLTRMTCALQQKHMWQWRNVQWGSTFHRTGLSWKNWCHPWTTMTHEVRCMDHLDIDPWTCLPLFHQIDIWWMSRRAYKRMNIIRVREMAHSLYVRYHNCTENSVKSITTLPSELPADVFKNRQRQIGTSNFDLYTSIAINECLVRSRTMQ